MLSGRTEAEAKPEDMEEEVEVDTVEEEEVMKTEEKIAIVKMMAKAKEKMVEISTNPISNATIAVGMVILQGIVHPNRTRSRKSRNDMRRYAPRTQRWAYVRWVDRVQSL